MGQFNYDEQNGGRVLLYTLSESETRDEITYGMMTNNKIDGVIPVFYTQMDDKRILKYAIPSLQSVRQAEKEPLKKDAVISMLSGVLRIVENAETYLIPKESFVLDPEYIFWSPESASVSMICLPLENREQAVSVGEFCRSLISCITSAPGEDLSYVGRIMNYLNRSEPFRVQEFRALLNEISGIPAVQTPAWRKGASGNRGMYMPHPETPAVNQNIRTNVKPELARNSFDVPRPPERGQAGSSDPGTGGDGGAEPEDNISLLYLLQHYNKENAEQYKKQKERKKSADKSKRGDEGKNKVSKEGKVRKTQKTDEGLVPYDVPGMKKSAAPAAFAQDDGPAQKLLRDMEVGTGSENRAPSNEPEMIRSGYAVPGNSGNEPWALNKAGTGAAAYPTLERLKTGERITVDREMFRIGKKPGQNDYVIEDNSTVSRNHACIILKNGVYYLVDENSKNHSYINGKLVPPGRESRLADNDRISISNEDFIFRSTV